MPLAAVLAQTNDESRLLVLVIGLFVIAGALMVMTVWYWRYTDPKRFSEKPRPETTQPNRNPVARPRTERVQEPINITASGRVTGPGTDRRPVMNRVSQSETQP